MGRGGGGGSRGGGGGHRGGGGFHSSRSSFGSSHSSFSRSSYRPTTHHHYYYSYPRRRNVYYGGSRSYGSGTSTGSTGCLTVFVVIFILMMVAMSTSKCSFAGHKAYIDENVVDTQSDKFYTDNFSGKDNTFLFYIAYSKALDDEYQYIRYGADAADILDNNFNKFFDSYGRYYNDDVGLQLAYALNEFYEKEIYGKYDRIDTSESYDSSFIVDKIDFIDPAGQKLLEQVAKSLYNETGLQFQVAVVNYDKLPGAKTDNTKIFVVFIITAGVITGVYIGYSWWKKKKAQKNKEAEDAIRILNTPLDQFNSINYLAEKYDAPTQTGTTASSGADYTPVNNTPPSNNQSANDINNQIDSYTAGAKYDDDNDVF